MTAEKLQDPVSTPAIAHLSPVQRAVFNQALSEHLSARTSAAEIEAELRVELFSGEVKLVFAGDAAGQLHYLRVNDNRFGAYAEVGLALLHVQESTNDHPSAHFMAATLADGSGNAEVTSVQVLDLAELFSRSVEVEYRHNNTGCRAVCPLSGEVFKPHIGEHPFLAGTWDPVFEGAVPPAGPANEDPSRARWTVGEVQAFMVSQWRAESAARDKAVAPSPDLSDRDYPF